MGQKTHPRGLRLGILDTWDSKWFSNREYAQWLTEDISIRKFIKERLTRAGIAKMRFSYHRGAIFEHAAGRARRAENDTKTIIYYEAKTKQKWSQNRIKKVSEITFQTRIQNEAFWRPTWDPKGSQDGSLIHIFSDPNGTTIRLREISLGYQFTGELLNKIPFKTLSLNLSGSNLWYKAVNFPDGVKLNLPLFFFVLKFAEAKTCWPFLLPVFLP